MAISDRLELLLTADPSNLISAFDRSASVIDERSKSMEGSIQRVGSAMLKIGGAGIGIGGLLTQLGSGEQEAEGQLKAAITAAGQDIGDYQDRIDEALSHEEKFAHGHEDTDAALRILTTAYGDTGKALDNLSVVTDYAAFKHESLAEAASTVAKIAGGSIRPLKELGIQVKTNADGTKDYAGAIEEMGRKLSGQADASVDSFTGKLRVFGTELKDRVAEIGEQWGPAILGLSTGLTALGAVASAAAGVQGRLAAAHLASATAAEADATAQAEAAAAAQASAAAATEAATAASALTFTEEELTAGLLAYNDALALSAASTFGAIPGLEGLATSNAAAASAAEADAAAQASLASGADVATASLTAEEGALAASGAAFGPWGIAAAAAIIAVSEAWDILGSKQNNNPLGAASANLTADAQQISQAFLALKFEGNANDANDFLEGLVKQGDAGVGALMRLKHGIEDDVKTGVLSQQQGAEYTADIDRSIGEAKDKQKILTENIQAGTGNAKQLADQFKQIAADADKAEAAALQLAPADIRVQRGALSIEDDQSKVQQAQNKLAWDRASHASDDVLQQDMRDLASANLDLRQAINDQAQAQAELTKTQDTANGSLKDNNYYTGLQIDDLKNLADTTTGPLHQALNQEIWDMTVATNKANDHAKALEYLAHLNSLGLAGTAAGALAGGGGPIDTTSFPGGSIKARAGGGHTSGLTLVGERGPELVNFGAGGHVYNNADTQRMMGGGTTNITVVHPDAFAAADEVVRGLNRRRILESAA